MAAFEGILGLDEELSHATATAPTTTTKAATTLLVTEVKNYYYEICKAGHAPGASPIVRNHHSRRRALLCCKGLSRVKCGQVNAECADIVHSSGNIARIIPRECLCANKKVKGEWKKVPAKPNRIIASLWFPMKSECVCV